MTGNAYLESHTPTLNRCNLHNWNYKDANTIFLIDPRNICCASPDLAQMLSPELRIISYYFVSAVWSWTKVKISLSISSRSLSKGRGEGCKNCFGLPIHIKKEVVPSFGRQKFGYQLYILNGLVVQIVGSDSVVLMASYWKENSISKFRSEIVCELPPSSRLWDWPSGSQEFLSPLVSWQPARQLRVHFV